MTAWVNRISALKHLNFTELYLVPSPATIHMDLSFISQKQKLHLVKSVGSKQNIARAKENIITQSIIQFLAKHKGCDCSRFRKAYEAQSFSIRLSWIFTYLKKQHQEEKKKN